MKRIVVNKKYNNKKINTVILNNFKLLSTNAFYKALRKKDIKVNGSRIKENIIVHEGDIIEIYIADNVLYPNKDINIIYEDENILLVDKPSNMEVVGDDSLSDIVRKLYPDLNINPCHRLDRNTSGLVLFAKNDLSLSILLNKFKNGEIEKHYLAKVYGIPNSKHEVLEAYLFKDSKKSIVYISDIPKKRL